MTERNEQYAYFTVCGDFDPTHISTLVGVKPTESWHKGEINPRTHYERKFSRWSLCSRLERSRRLEDHIADVLEQLRHNTPAFIEVSAEYGGVMQLVGYFRSDYPGLSFDRALVKSLAEFALSVDCDFYFLYSHEREDS